MCGACWQDWKRRAADLRREVYTLYLACRDPRTPRFAKILGLCVIGYALSPIDLIPDFVPVLGYLDDLILIPLGIAFVLRAIPPEVMAECREKAAIAMAGGKPKNWIAAGIIALIWIGLAIGGVALTIRLLR